MLPFDLLIVDIDGVMTDGTKMYDREGKVFGKKYCDLDFTAIKRFKAAGINVCFLSGDEVVNRAMAETRKVDFFHNRPGEDKVYFIPVLKQWYKTKEIAYVGDDYYDIAIMKAINAMAPLSSAIASPNSAAWKAIQRTFCPKNSPAIVKRTAQVVLGHDSGTGVLAGIFDFFEELIPDVYPKDSPDVNPK